MNQLMTSELPKPWKVYTAIWVFSKNEKGYGCKNYLRLEPQTGSYPDFPSAYSRMARIGEDIEHFNGGHISTMSRTEDYCVDTWVAKSDDNITEKDCYAPDLCYIEVIATTFALSLKSE